MIKRKKVTNGKCKRKRFKQTETTLEQAGNNIKNLLLTSKGERVMQPEFGSDLRDLLFEQYTEDLTDRIKDAIEEAMSTWLPYIVISSVDVIEDKTNPNQTKVDLDFSLNYEPNRFDSITLNFDNTTETTSGTSSGY